MGKRSGSGARRLTQLGAMRPRTPKQLHRFVQVVLGVDVPRRAAGWRPAALDYLEHSFFETPDRSGDAVVWANRGGGKTMLGAAATLLDLIFKPGIEVRILGGSLEQSCKMYEHLLKFLDRSMLRQGGGILAGEPTQRRIELAHGSRVEILAQSHKSVRGTRVHKLRCDEVDEFDPEVWQAAQMVTRSGRCGQVDVRGSIEALSTMHRPAGLMNTLVDGAGEAESQPTQPRLFKWNAMDVIARCPDDRPCQGCVLWADCGGSAKQASGFLPVADLIAQRLRTSDHTWAAEMMCERPRVSDSVYPSFDVGRHVVGDEQVAARFGGPDRGRWIGGMDFGLRCPTVFVWAQTFGQGEDAALVVMDEYVQANLTLGQHVERMRNQADRAGWPELWWVGVDPAGGQRNGQTGMSDIDILRQAGYVVRTRRSTIRQGIERIRRRLDRGTLLIHRRCEKLIQSLRSYHFDFNHIHREEPIKDGPDHACDALRYMVLNLERGAGEVWVRRYV